MPSALASFLLAAHAAPPPVSVDPPAALVPQAIEDSFAVQREVGRLREAELGKTAGFKLAFAGVLGYPGVVSGHIHSSRVLNSGSKIALSAFNKIGVEVEVLCRLGRDLPPTDVSSLTLDNIGSYVDTVAPAIEVIDNRYPKMDVKLMLADSFLAWGVVIGPETPASQMLEKLPDLPTRLRINGQVVAEGNSKIINGNPLTNILGIAKDFAKAGIEMKKGMVFSTGSTIVPYWPSMDLKEGFEVEGEVDGLGKVGCVVVGDGKL